MIVNKVEIIVINVDANNLWSSLLQNILVMFEESQQPKTVFFFLENFKCACFTFCSLTLAFHTILSYLHYNAIIVSHKFLPCWSLSFYIVFVFARTH